MLDFVMTLIALSWQLNWLSLLGSKDPAFPVFVLLVDPQPSMIPALPFSPERVHRDERQLFHARHHHPHRSTRKTLGPIEQLVTITMQATSDRCYLVVPSLDLLDNIIPGKEEQIEWETLTILRSMPVGVYFHFHHRPPPTPRQILEVLSLTEAQTLGASNSPVRMVNVHKKVRPQSRYFQTRAAVRVRKVRECHLALDVKLVCLTNNAGIAASSVTNAEVVVSKGVVQVQVYGIGRCI
ncbi:hypothetical protein BKA70DRAFT_1419482 [Coprinopsis sp. MPI-PUGE-AT-0042]|nr:hypothetical protein BKA70DRAFT_1419482 [Coprinopsis sp. MPI-PUGE-AT-0042]